MVCRQLGKIPGNQSVHHCVFRLPVQKEALPCNAFTPGADAFRAALAGQIADCCHNLDSPQSQYFESKPGYRTPGKGGMTLAGR